MREIKFKSTDGNFSVEIDDSTLDFIKHEYIKTKSETGGILIGNYSADRYNAIIKSVTGPPKDSKQSKYSFERGINGLIKILDDNWNSGNYYLGEWHYHPNSSSKPSIVDDIQMIKFANDKKLKCPEPILLVLGGNQYNGWELSLYVYTKDGQVSLVKN